MRNVGEGVWLVCVAAALCFATFMVVFAVMALGYWMLGLMGLA